MLAAFTLALIKMLILNWKPELTMNEVTFTCKKTYMYMFTKVLLSVLPGFFQFSIRSGGWSLDHLAPDFHLKVLGTSPEDNRQKVRKLANTRI